MKEEDNETMLSTESFREYHSEAETNYEDTVSHGRWNGYDASEYPSINVQKRIIMQVAREIEKLDGHSGHAPVRISIPRVDTEVAGEENPRILAIELPGEGETVVCSSWLGDYEAYIEGMMQNE